MEFDVAPLGSDTNLVTMRGRLDVAGCGKAELPFTAAVASSGQNAILDMGGLEFIGSLGIRMLVSTARVLQRRDRRIVMFGPTPAVREVLDTVALDQMIPIFATESEARTHLGL